MQNSPTMKPSLKIGWTREFFRQPRAVRLRQVSGETMNSGCFPRVKCENGEICVRGTQLDDHSHVQCRESLVCRRFLFVWLSVRDRNEVVKSNGNVSSICECEPGFVALVEDVCNLQFLRHKRWRLRHSH